MTQVCVSVDGATASDLQRHPTRRRLRSASAPTSRASISPQRPRRVTAAGALRMVMMQRNVHEMVDIVELAARLGVDESRLSPSRRVRGPRHGAESLEIHQSALELLARSRASRAATLGMPVPTHPAPFATRQRHGAGNVGGQLSVSAPTRIARIRSSTSRWAPAATCCLSATRTARRRTGRSPRMTLDGHDLARSAVHRLAAADSRLAILRTCAAAAPFSPTGIPNVAGALRHPQELDDDGERGRSDAPASA